MKNQTEILKMTEAKTRELAGTHPSSTELKNGLPIFYKQLMEVLGAQKKSGSGFDRGKLVEAANESNEPAMAQASGHSDEVALAETAGRHGVELLRLGYTLSHVVHAYGAMCQAITELATSKDASVSAHEFHDLNRCLDVAIAGAVTEYQSQRNSQIQSREVEQLGFLAHELRNALTAITISLQLIKKGTVGFGGSTGAILDRSLKQIADLIDRSLTEVRLRVDPKIQNEQIRLLEVIDQIVVTAGVEAEKKGQILEAQVDPKLMIEGDQQLLYSVISNIIQNALKYTRVGGKISIWAREMADQVLIEVRDECGGLLTKTSAELFQPFVQKNENRQGLGLGLTIAKRAVELSHGTIEAFNLPDKGCIFKILLPQKTGKKLGEVKPAA